MVNAELLADFYGAAIDRRRLSLALDGVRQRTNAMTATFHLFERTPERLRHRWQSSCSNTPKGANEMALLDELNPRTVADCNPETSGPSVLEDHYLPDSFQPDVRRWQDQLRSFGMGQFLAARIPLDGRHEVGVALHGRLAGGALEPDSRALLVELMPHVREAIGHVIRMEEQREQGSHALCALQELRHGMLTCDATGRITAMNAAAAQLLSWACGSGMARDFDTGCQLPRALLTRAAQGERVIRWQGSGGVLQVCVKPLACADDNAKLLRKNHNSCQVRESGPDTGWVFTLADPAETITVDAEYLARAFDVTQAEALLLRHLAQGGDVSEFAARRDVSIHTARSQLKALMSKTGTTRQADLVRMALGGPLAFISTGKDLVHFSN